MSQLLGLWVEGWYLVALYAPHHDPNQSVDPETELGGLVHDLFVQSNLEHVPRFMCGDVNNVPDKTGLTSLLSFFVEYH